MSRGYHSDSHKPTREQERRRDKVLDQRRHNREVDLGKVNWEAYEHRQMWDMVMSAKPELMAEKVDGWHELSKGIKQTTRDVHKALGELLGTWRGSAAVKAAQSNTKLTTWGGDATTTAARIGNGLGRYTDAVCEARKQMPTPVHPQAESWFRAGHDVTTLNGPNGAYMLEQLLDDQMPTQEQKVQRKAEAVAVMEAYESDSRNVRHELPRFEAAPRTTQQVSGSSRPSWPAQPDDDGDGPVDEGAGGVGVGTGPAVGVGSGDEHYGGTSAAGYVSTSGGGPGGSPSGSGYGGLGGVGGVPGGGDAARGGAAFGVAARGAAAAQAAETAAAQAAARAAGMGGMGMYPPMGHGANGEDEKEHRNRFDEGIDLFDDLPPAFPPVFGA